MNQFHIALHWDKTLSVQINVSLLNHTFKMKNYLVMDTSIMLFLRLTRPEQHLRQRVKKIVFIEILDSFFELVDLNNDRFLDFAVEESPNSTNINGTKLSWNK